MTDLEIIINKKMLTYAKMGHYVHVLKQMNWAVKACVNKNVSVFKN